MEGARTADAESPLATLHPAYFALVMATAIVSIATRIVGLELVPKLLFGLNLLFYPILWGLTIARFVRHRARFLADVADHGRGVGFFTLVAATCVLGSQCIVVGGVRAPASWLWLLGILLYFTLVYSIFTLFTVQQRKPTLAEGINGGWLVSVVAAQAVAVLGAQLSASSPHADKLLFFCVTLWLGGGMLYFWIIGLIFYRYTFFTLAPSDLAPPYWINMGAAAISALAGALLVAAAEKSPVIGQILPFVRGLTLWWWATATWWIPILFILGLWRHVYRSFPLKYDPLYWGAVFPLGMYTVATARLSRAVDAPYLFAIPRAFVWVALGAWLLTFVGLVRKLGRGLISRH